MPLPWVDAGPDPNPGVAPSWIDSLEPIDHVGHWPFEEATANSSDVSGYGQTLVQNLGSIAWRQPGPAPGTYGKKLTNGYYSAAMGSALYSAQQWTISAWVNMHTTPASRSGLVYCANGRGGKYGPGLMIGGGDFGVPAGALRPVVFQYQVSPAEQMWSTYDPTELALNTWYMVTGSFDGSSLRIYRNAAHVGEAPGSPPGSGACNLQVCRASDIYSGYLPAIVHGVRYYNFKLSGDQIEALYYRTAAVAGRYYPPAWHPLGKVT